MPRYIDADAFDDTVQKLNGQGWHITNIDYKRMDRVLVEMPTADVVEVKHGKWICNPSDAIEAMFTKPKCSECGFESADGGNYCPNCGAKMEREEEK